MPQSNNHQLTQSVISEVRKFISGSVRLSRNPDHLNLTRTALNLLNNVPAVRDAVLQYFCNVFFMAVDKREGQLKNNQYAPIPEDAIIKEIHGVLLNNFVNSNSSAWAPIIFQWSVDLLGKISSEYAKHKSDNPLIIDTLQRWMSCNATRTLVEMTTHCLKFVLDTEVEQCISTMWSISITHRPNFDWVIAHVGSCFPNVIIKKLLCCGLRDFCSLEYSDFGKHTIKKKLSSVVDVLSYLANSHFQEIRSAMLNLFLWSLDDNVEVNEESRKQQFATVPFLLNLAAISPILSKVLISDISQILKPDVVPKIVSFSSEWIRFFDNNPMSLINTTVHIALGCNQGALQIINLLLDTSLNSSTQSVKYISREILELILERIEDLTRSDQSQLCDVPLLSSIKQDLPVLITLLLSDQPLKIKTTVKLLSLLGAQNPNVLITAATYLLQKAKTDYHLGILVRFMDDNTNYFSKKKSSTGYFSQVLDQALREVYYNENSSDLEKSTLFQNLTVLLKWEKSNLTKSLSLRAKFIHLAVKENLHQIASQLIKTESFDLASDIIEILNYLSFESDNSFVSVQLNLKITKAIVHYFFMCIEKNDPVKKQRGSKIVCRFLRILAKHSQYSKMLALREILETVTNKDTSTQFGTKGVSKTLPAPSLLLQQNQKQRTSTILAQRHSSVFHAGVIGQTRERTPENSFINEESVTLNSTLLINVLKACCSFHGVSINSPIDPDSMIMISLILVELIPPDAMYNGLPWPEEDYTKVTVERDLHIKRAFKNTPILWTLLRFLAWYRPALAYCSVILRAIVATNMNNWCLQEGEAITEVMTLGQLLPSPLHSITSVLEHLEPQQVILILRDVIWSYMHENVPSPMLFTRTPTSNVAWRDSDVAIPNPRVTDTLRLSLMTNIKNLGFLYAALFYNEQKQ